MVCSQIKIRCTAILMLLLCGCGEHQIQVLKDDPMATLHKQTEFTIRANPCGCIVNTPELNYEIKLGRQWRRIFIEKSESNSQALADLRSRFLKYPYENYQIEGKFLNVFYQWLPGHNAPGIRLDAIVEPANAAKTPPAISLPTPAR